MGMYFDMAVDLGPGRYARQPAGLLYAAAKLQLQGCTSPYSSVRQQTFEWGEQSPAW